MNISAIYYDAPTITRDQIHAQSTGVQAFSQADDPVDGISSENFATLETGGWRLDGRKTLIGESLQGYWWSAKPSDETGWLEQPAVLTLQLQEPVSITGMTFTFWPAGDQWCSTIRVSWYNGDQLLLQDTFFPDRTRWILQQKVEGFDKVQVELLQTAGPFQFAKLAMLEIGQVWQFEKADIISAELNTGVDPTLRTVPVDTMQVKVHTPPGAVLLPQEGQRLVLWWEDGALATHYITGSCRESRDVYTLQAQSCVGLLNKRFLGGMYTGIPVEDLLDLIFEDQEYYLDNSLRNNRLAGYLPICTQQEALQQVALAIGAIASTTQDGVCWIYPIPETTQSTFREDMVFQGATLSNHRRYSAVEVAAHGYEQMEQWRLLLDEEPVYGTQLFLFQKPYHEYSASGGEIVESDANYVRIKAQGPVTLYGREHLHTMQIFRKSDPQVVGRERENVFQLLDATLVSSENAQAVLQQQYNIARLWQTMEMQSIINNQMAGHKATAVTPWDSQVEGYIASVKNRLTDKGQVAEIKLICAEQEVQS